MNEQPNCSSTRGLLTHSEIKNLASMLSERRPRAEIDDYARSMLVTRDAATELQAERWRRGWFALLGQHLLVEAVARGNVYDVLKAQHLALGRVDAVKVLRPGGSSSAEIARRLRQARIQSALRSRRIARVYNTAFSGTAYYVVAEYIPGASLMRAVIERAPLTVHEAAMIGRDVASALQELHSRGLVHGALRPSKIMTACDGPSKLVDIGSAEQAGRIYRRGSEHLLLGDYMPPEAIEDGDATERSDVYLLGCVLYFAITGRAPFPGGESQDKARAHRWYVPDDPIRLRADLDIQFVRLIGDMMAKRPSERVASAAEVVGRLSLWTNPSSGCAPWA